ncbi:MAG: GerMN domain-containing protein [Candidatus Paceibacterota bacterium]
MKKYLIAAVVIMALILVGLYFYTSQTSISTIDIEDNFSHDGVVIKDNPGFKPGVWFLTYEEPGSPGLSVELDLNSAPAQSISLTQGERVHVEGTLRESVVVVRSITPLSTREVGTSIKLYFYNPALDQGPGGVQCSRNGLVVVDREVPQTITPLKDSIELLLRGEISDEERAAGIESEFPLAGLTLKNATISNGVATLTFDDPQNKTVGGSCRTGILWAQIEATAKQFPTVQNVRFMPEELFQP